MSTPLNPQWEAGRKAGFAEGYDRGFDDGFSDGAGETDATLLKLIDDLWAFINGIGDDDPTAARGLEERVRAIQHTS